MEQHPVPQHIASFEFKLFGNLTVRQFVSLAIPMSFAAIIFFSNLPTLVRMPLALLFGGFGFFVALVPVQGRPFDKWIVAFIKAITSPTQRIWVKEEKLPEFLNIVISAPAQEEAIPEAITAQGRERLLSYLRSLPKNHESGLDVKEQLAVERLEIPMETSTQGNLPPPIIWPAQNFAQTQSPSLPSNIPYQGKMAESLPPINIGKRMASAPSPKISDHAKPYILPGLERKLGSQTNTPGAVQLVNFPKIEPKAKLASETNFSIENVIPIHTPDRQITFLAGIGKTRVRKLHFAPPTNYNLGDMPIRGERKFDISEELKNRFQTSPLSSDAPKVVLPIKEDVAQVQEVKIPTVQNIEERRVPAKTQLVPKSTQGKIKIDLKKEEPKPREEKTYTASSPKISTPKASPSPQAPLAKAQIIPLTNKPNVLSGLVISREGTPIDGAILIVHDANGVPARALKTSKLGQFLSATPLSPGKYTIEVESKVEKFDPITINLEDKVLSPLEITSN